MSNSRRLDSLVRHTTPIPRDLRRGRAGDRLAQRVRSAREAASFTVPSLADLRSVHYPATFAQWI
jgi:predicted RNase H-like nuclease